MKPEPDDDTEGDKQKRTDCQPLSVSALGLIPVAPQGESDTATRHRTPPELALATHTADRPCQGPVPGSRVEARRSPRSTVIGDGTMDRHEQARFSLCTKENPAEPRDRKTRRDTTPEGVKQEAVSEANWLS